MTNSHIFVPRKELAQLLTDMGRYPICHEFTDRLSEMLTQADSVSWEFQKIEEGKAHVRWVIDNTIYGRPTLSDLQEVMQEMLAKPEEKV